MASSKQEKKQSVFLKYSKNLNFLKQNGFLKDIKLKYDETYICPICLRQFCKDDLNEGASNKLTLEHAPPRSAKGRGIILTCEQCNNEAGTDYDRTIAEWLFEKDNLSMDVSGVKKAKLHPDGLSQPMNVKVNYIHNPDGIDTMDLDLTGNHPNLLKEFNEKGRVGMDYVIPVKVNFLKVETALLKSAYLLMFAKFGYSFIFNEVYNSIRMKLLSKDDYNYFTNYHLDEVNGSFKDGVYESAYPLGEGFICILKLVSKNETIHRYAVHLPIPYTNREETLEVFAKANVMSIEIPWRKKDFLSNQTDISQLHDWFRRVGASHIRSKGYRGIKLLY